MTEVYGERKGAVEKEEGKTVRHSPPTPQKQQQQHTTTNKQTTKQHQQHQQQTNITTTSTTTTTTTKQPQQQLTTTAATTTNKQQDINKQTNKQKLTASDAVWQGASAGRRHSVDRESAGAGRRGLRLHRREHGRHRQGRWTTHRAQ